MKISSVKIAAIAALLAPFAASAMQGAPSVDRSVWVSQKERAKTLKVANAKRLRDAGETGKVSYFSVPALSEVMRLDDTYPVDGDLNGTVRCVLAKGEFESCSFQLFSFEDFEDVKLEVKLGLKNDIRVVKLWFQNGNGWVSYFNDVGLKLTPELLLHDENLIKVDKGDRPANYARVKKDGKDEFVWISAPRSFDKRDGFKQYDKGFVDAEKLLPVRLEKNSFKQFFITINAAKNQNPGVYKGVVNVTCKGETLASVPIAVRVLPFELPMPKGYLNPKIPYVHSCMGAMPSLGRLKSSIGNDKEAEKCFRAWLQSLYDHSVFHAPYITEGNASCIPLLKEIGYPLDYVLGNPMVPWYALNFGGRMSWRNLRDAQVSAKKCYEFYNKHLPGATMLCAHGDEQGTAFVTTHREMYREYEKYGIKVGCAGHDPLLIKGGFAYGFIPIACDPRAAYEKSRPWREIGTETLGFYASQHTGSENPQFTRRQHGMLGWLNGLTMAYNYEFAVGSFNDLVNDVYRPMVVTYANSQGLMETIQYAGFREACDDIRYGTYLLQLAQEAIDKKDDVDAVIAGKKARMYLAMLDQNKADLNVVRLEMIERIMNLRKILGK